MPILNNERQITLTLEECHLASLESGDEYETFVDNLGYIKIVRKNTDSPLSLKTPKLTGPGPEII